MVVRRGSWGGWVLSGALLVGCGPAVGDVDDAGAEASDDGADGGMSAGSATTGTPGTMTLSGPADDSTTDSVDPDPSAGPEPVGLVGYWLGYGNQLSLPSKSDRVVLNVTDVSADNQVAGTIAFGVEGVLPPATDGNVGYPPASESSPNPRIWFPVEMFAYPFVGTFDPATGRLLGEVSETDVWATWCTLQTPYLEGDDYACVPNCASMSDGQQCTLMCPEETLVLDCRKVELCSFSSVCRCDAGGCVADPDGATFEVDLNLSGSELDGVIDEAGMVYLVRQ